MKNISKILLILAALFISAPAKAATYYVRQNGSDTNCAGTTEADYPGSPAGACAFKTPNGCIHKPLVGGDVCLLDTGTYVNPNPNPSDMTNGVWPDFDLSGVHPASTVTIKANPGQSPVVCKNDGSGGCGNVGAVLGVNWDATNGDASNIVIGPGIHFHGGLYLQHTSNIRITGNDIQGICDQAMSGHNEDAIWIAGPGGPGILIDHNVIHDLPVIPNSTGRQPIQSWYTTGAIVEYNTFYKGSAGTWDHCIMEKDKPSNLIVRFNDCQYSNILVGGLQVGGGSGLGTGNAEYGNVLRAGTIYVGIDSGNAVYNNTVIGGIAAVGDPDNGHPTSMVSYNNITSNPAGSIYDCPTCNSAIFGNSGAWGAVSTYVWDFNMYDSDNTWGYNIDSGSSTAGSLSAWRSAFSGSALIGTTGREAHSQSASGPCTFTSGSDTPYHVASSTTCKTGACTDWPTCSSATKEFGAYGITSCVGSPCGSVSDITPPSAPTGLRVQ